MIRGIRPLLSPVARTSIAIRAPVAPVTTISFRFASQKAQIQGPKPSRQPNDARLLIRVPFTQWAKYDAGNPLAPSKDEIKKHEKKVAGQKVEARPDQVSSESTTVKMTDSMQGPDKDADKEFSKGVVEDLHKVEDTFALTSIPRAPYLLGLVGTLPYLATSLSTVYLTWNLSTEWPASSKLVNSLHLSHETAEQWLHLMEPLQLGYGAVIISFLGAIHWGMEWATDTPSRSRSRFRYGVGVVALAVAWPTLLMPIEYALTAQFAAFTFLYFADARAMTRGWAPAWYGSYRFVLTFIVGGALLISLVSRTKMGDARARLSTAILREEFHHPAGDSEQRYSESGWARREAEEKERMKKKRVEEEKKEKKKTMSDKAEKVEKEAEKTRKNGDDKKRKQDGGDKGKAEMSEDGDEKDGKE